jgi:hypothetical protein
LATFDEQLARSDGLDQVSVGAELDRRHRQLHAVLAGDHHDRHLGMAAAYMSKQLHAGFARHVDVEQREPVLALPQALPSSVRVTRTLAGVALLTHYPFLPAPQCLVVVDYQQLRHLPSPRKREDLGDL